MAFTNNDSCVDHVSDWTVDKIRIEDNNIHVKELHLETFSLKFSNSSFVIRVNLHHPSFMVYYYLFGVLLSL